ncbi:PR domain zinc finger protein 8 isoform X3 [Mustela erminea]|uniref:PR domain zinc finger protein 8 isoform X3 n=1 Tax=Mustela erminea TaxID=36723 RepID=UPI001386B9BB|nr:PR domain zinc finger protein 8 isoform X3 [Mustela erminea]
MMEDSGIQRGIWDGDAKAVQQCLTDIFTSVYTTCDIPENAIFGPCILSHTSLYDSIAFIALKSTDKRTVPYIFRVDTSAANGSSEGLMWLRLVQSARDKEEQNLEAYIKNGQLFYRSLRRIAKDEELLVWVVPVHMPGVQPAFPVRVPLRGASALPLPQETAQRGRQPAGRARRRRGRQGSRGRGRRQGPAAGAAGGAPGRRPQVRQSRPGAPLPGPLPRGQRPARGRRRRQALHGLPQPGPGARELGRRPHLLPGPGPRRRPAGGGAEPRRQRPGRRQGQAEIPGRGGGGRRRRRGAGGGAGALRRAAAARLQGGPGVHAAAVPRRGQLLRPGGQRPPVRAAQPRDGRGEAQRLRGGEEGGARGGSAGGRGRRGRRGRRRPGRGGRRRRGRRRRPLHARGRLSGGRRQAAGPAARGPPAQPAGGRQPGAGQRLHVGAAAGRRGRRGRGRGRWGGGGRRRRPGARAGRAQERLLAARALLRAAVAARAGPEAGRARAVPPRRRRGPRQALPRRGRPAGREAPGRRGPERRLRGAGGRRRRRRRGRPAQAEPLPLRHRLLAQELGGRGGGGGGGRGAPAAAAAVGAHAAAAVLHVAVSARAELVRQVQRVLPHDLRPGVPHALAPQEGVRDGAPGEAAARGEAQVPHLQRVLQGAPPPLQAHDLAQLTREDPGSPRARAAEPPAGKTREDTHHLLVTWNAAPRDPAHTLKRPRAAPTFPFHVSLRPTFHAHAHAQDRMVDL